MLEIRLNGEALTLNADTEASIEYASGLLNESLDDSFSLPFSVPVRGNERLLGNTHQWGRRKRPLKFPGAEIWRDGTRLHPGILYVEGSNEEEGTISVSIAVEGFISGLDDRTLRELDMGKTVSVKNLPLHAKVTNTKFWPQVAYVFPMISAPELFSSQENPAWSPDTSEWDDGSTYEINDLVTHVGDTGAVARKETYQATGSVSAGLPPPPLYTASWRRTAFGIVNHWNHETQTFYTNDESGNFYSLIPLFFVKEIVKRGLAFYGLGVEGEWWDDERHHQLIMWNNRTLDNRTATFFFRAAQTDVVSGPSPLRFLLANDSIAPNEDTSDVWDTGTSTGTAPADGTYHFTLHYTLGLSSPAAVRIDLMPEGGIAPLWSHQHFISESGFTFTHELTVLLPENSSVYLRAFIPEGGGTATMTISDAWISGWAESTSIVNTFGNDIVPAHHMPAMSLKALLQSLRDVFGLRLRPTANGDAVRMDYMAALVTASLLEDMTSRVRGTIALQHTDRMDGFRLHWGHNLPALPDLDRLELLGPFSGENMLSVPSNPQMYTVANDTRRVYIPRVFNGSALRWVPEGWLLPDGTVGDAAEPADYRTIEPELLPMLMDVVWVRGKRFAVPVTDDRGNSLYFRTGNNDPTPLFSYWRGMVYNSAVIGCEGGFMLHNASYGPVNGLYCPDGTYNGHPRWTKSGGVSMEDSIYCVEGADPFMGEIWHLTSGGTVLDSPVNLRYISNSSTDDPASMVWINWFWTSEPVPIYDSLPSSSPALYPSASSFEHGMTGEAPAWDTSLDWSSDRGPLALHQRAMLEALVGAETVVTDLELSPGMLTGRDYERGRTIHHHRCFILTLPVEHSTEPGRMISEGARLLKLRNP